MQSLYLLARIAGARVAIPSDCVESVVRVHDMVAVPRSDPSVAGLFALRSRVLTLIDSSFVVTGEHRPQRPHGLAIVAEISGHHFGLLVDSVEDAVDIDIGKIERNIASPRLWSNIATGLIDVDGEIAMIVDPSKLIMGHVPLAA